MYPLKFDYVQFVLKLLIYSDFKKKSFSSQKLHIYRVFISVLIPVWAITATTCCATSIGSNPSHTLRIPLVRRKFNSECFFLSTTSFCTDASPKTYSLNRSRSIFIQPSYPQNLNFLLFLFHTTPLIQQLSTLSEPSAFYWVNVGKKKHYKLNKGMSTRSASIFHGIRTVLQQYCCLNGPESCLDLLFQQPFREAPWDCFKLSRNDQHNSHLHVQRLFVSILFTN